VTAQRRVISIASAVTIALTAGACSSTSKSATGSSATSQSATSQSATGQSAPSSTGVPIKVGEICACSGIPGLSQFDVPEQQAVKAWADSVNASGGIDGHPVQVIADDDAGNPGNSILKAQALISAHVVAIIDDTPLVQTWSSAVEAANVPVVGSQSVNPPFDTSPDFYAEGQTQQSSTQAVVAVAKAAGATNIADWYCAEAPICSETVSNMKADGKAAGVPDVYSASISAVAPNYTAQCVAARQDHVASVILGVAAVTADRIAADCAQQGFNPIYVADAAGFGLNQASAPVISKDLWGEYPNLPFWANTPAVQAFNTAMDKYFPGVRENTNLFTEDAFEGWISGRLLQTGIQSGGLTPGATPSSAELTKGLDSLKNETLGGLAPPLTFAAGKAHPINCYFEGRISDGTPVLENNGKPTCVNVS
jgi:branched-chain amino acid transport system substrate-binding protein